MLEFLVEVLLQFVLELLAQWILHVTGRGFGDDRKLSFWLVLPGIAALGAVAGWISLAILPEFLIRSADWRLVYLVLVPIAVGAAIACIGAWIRRRGGVRSGIDRFLGGWAFAFTFALVRHFAAR
jgi:hypothetical protein